MESSTYKKSALLPSLVVSLFLMIATIDSGNAQASTVNVPTQAPIQLAWWAGGGHWGGGWHHGYGGRVYVQPYCHNRCWVDNYGYEHCRTFCD